MHIAVVILSYNNYDLTAACIRSLSRSSWKDYFIVVVDNASPDNSGDRLRRTFRDVKVLCNRRNLGYCRGNNVGLQYCLNSCATHVLVLNNDMVVEPGTLGALAGESARRGDREHVLTGKILCDPDRETVWYAGGRLSYLLGNGISRGRLKKDRTAYDRPSRVSFVLGCMIFAPLSVFMRIGLFDDRMFMYFDDVEFSLRFRKAGIPAYYVPSARVYHRVGAGRTLGDYSPLYLYYTSRNRVLIHPNRFYRAYLLLVTLGISAGKVLWIMTHPATSQKRKKIVSLLKGSREAFSLVCGK